MQQNHFSCADLSEVTDEQAALWCQTMHIHHPAEGGSENIEHSLYQIKVPHTPSRRSVSAKFWKETETPFLCLCLEAALQRI